MNNIRFKRTMMETLKYDYDNYPNYEKLLTILRYSNLNFNQTNIFATRKWQLYEDIELRVPVNLLREAKNLEQEFRSLIFEIYQETDEYDLKNILIKPKIIETEIDEIKEHEIFFEDIKEKILQSIRSAKYTIWAALSWFTDDDLFLELKKQKEKGLSIRVIISDEKENNIMISKLKKENIEFKIIEKFGLNDWNRMHGKFCIIDLEYVLHGSYNWTKSASYNKETLGTALDKEYVKKFCDEFLTLYSR